MTHKDFLNKSQSICLRLSVLAFGLLLSLISCKNKHQENVIAQANDSALKQSQIIYEEVMPIEEFNDSRTTNDKFFSGTKSLYIDAKTEFSTGFKLTIGKINNFKNIDSLEISLMHYVTKKLKGVKVVWTIDDDKAKNISWNGSFIENKNLNAWEKLKLGFKLNSTMVQANHILNIYIWNEGKEELWVDDFEIKLFGSISSKPDIADSKSNFYYDFETKEGVERAEKIGSSIARSGKMTCNLSDGSEYGIGIKKSFKEFGNQKIKKLSASIWVYPTEEKHDVVLTFSSVNKKTGDLNFWHGKSTLEGKFPLNQWTILNSAIDLPTEKFDLEDEVEVGIWNKGKTSVVCDDLRIVYGAQPERPNQPSKLKPSENIPLALNYLTFDQTKLEALTSIEPTTLFLKGLFYQHDKGLESILQINKRNAMLWWYNQTTKAFEKIWETKDKNSFLLMPNTYAAAGDFDGDRSADILQVNKSDLSWKLYQFKSKDWVLKMSGENAFPKNWINNSNQIFTTNKINSKFKSVLARVANQQVELLQLENGQWISSVFANSKSDLVYNENDLLFDWNNDYYLKLNTEWRFDLKQIQMGSNGATINVNLDFKKDDKGSNPKYYEHTTLLSGNFLSAKNKQLLVCYFNCINSDFKGENCEGIEHNIDFPNAISFYY
jgi:hypothetical protein